MNGWLRVWTVISLVCTVAALGVGLSNARTPSEGLSGLVNPARVSDLLQQMDEPGCAKFKDMNPGQFFTPGGLDQILGRPPSKRTVSVNEAFQCGRLIDYRNTTSDGRGPASSREEFLRDVDLAQRHYQAEVSEYWQQVVWSPVAVFLGSWAVFFVLRPVVLWVRAGFAQGVQE